MICPPCRVAWHEDCENNAHPAGSGLWCYCQHKDRVKGRQHVPVA